jgi:hypothetical protein
MSTKEVSKNEDEKYERCRSRYEAQGGRHPRFCEFPKISHLKNARSWPRFPAAGALSKAARRAKVDRPTHYNWLKEDPWYVEAFGQAVIEAGDSLQDKLTEIAFEGNVTAAIFLLKGLKSQLFKERQAVEVQWSGDLAELSASRLDALERSLLAAHPQLALEGQTVVETAAELVETPST